MFQSDISLRTVMLSKQYTIQPTLEQQRYASPSSRGSSDHLSPPQQRISPSRSYSQDDEKMSIQRQSTISPPTRKRSIHQENLFTHITPEQELSFSRAKSEVIAGRNRSNSMQTNSHKLGAKMHRAESQMDLSANCSNDGSILGSGDKSPLVAKIVQLESDIQNSMVFEKPSPVGLSRGSSSIRRSRCSSVLSLQQLGASQDGSQVSPVDPTESMLDQKAGVLAMSRGSSTSSGAVMVPPSPRMIAAQERLLRGNSSQLSQVGSPLMQNSMVSPLCRNPIHFQNS
eukprot:CAMPEP_0184692234 /NCGR_PEP_ID=MMETSP0313-20130426/798_1 /TAXON_ID=2792 /ORGANISM="Porphyridium aerugineum, Strain SAG 1380-2" /LENGTH=284 /DNA_ID=CAMNT_0027150049 /DNA_START=284 /DNA_END=1138 /DNA_ORIENTATION=+